MDSESTKNSSLLGATLPQFGSIHAESDRQQMLRISTSTLVSYHDIDVHNSTLYSASTSNISTELSTHEGIAECVLNHHLDAGEVVNCMQAVVAMTLGTPWHGSSVIRTECMTQWEFH
jgi:hypothetical protein